MVKPESLLWPLLSSSGLELGLLEGAEAGPVSGSEKTRAGRAKLLRSRRGCAGPGAGALVLPPSSSLETRMKSSGPPLSVRPCAAEGVCAGGRAQGRGKKSVEKWDWVRSLRAGVPPPPTIIPRREPDPAGTRPITLHPPFPTPAHGLLLWRLHRFSGGSGGNRQIPTNRIHIRAPLCLKQVNNKDLL